MCLIILGLRRCEHFVLLRLFHLKSLVEFCVLLDQLHHVDLHSVIRVKKRQLLFLVLHHQVAVHAAAYALF